MSPFISSYLIPPKNVHSFNADTLAILCYTNTLAFSNLDGTVNYILNLSF